MSASDPNAKLLLSFIFLVLIAGSTAYYADRKGRSATNWFLIGLLLGILAPIILFFLSSLKNEEGVKTPAAAVSSSSVDESTAIESNKPTPVVVPEEDKLWHYLDLNHQPYGPVSLIALKDLWNTGQLELNSYVWSPGMAQWEKVDSLPDLKDALKSFHG